MAAPAPDGPPSIEAASGATTSDRTGRVVAPISVNGQGPFRFIVDTGANRSVLSQHLADRLGLAPTGEGQVHSVYGVAPAPLVQVRSLSYGALTLPAEQLPLLQGPVLAGEHGLLGVDGMAGRRLLLDFARNCIEITASEGARHLRGWAAVRGRLRFGHLVVVEGRINRQRVNVLLDTGSDTSLANTALRDLINANLQRNRSFYDTAATANAPIVLDRAIILRRLNVGALEVENVTAFVGDFHVFTVWDLIDEPTVLLGMDVLTQARGLAIDYARATVYFDVAQSVPGRNFGNR